LRGIARQMLFAAFRTTFSFWASSDRSNCQATYTWCSKQYYRVETERLCISEPNWSRFRCRL